MLSRLWSSGAPGGGKVSKESRYDLNIYIHMLCLPTRHQQDDVVFFCCFIFFPFFPLTVEWFF